MIGLPLDPIVTAASVPPASVTTRWEPSVQPRSAQAKTSRELSERLHQARNGVPSGRIAPQGRGEDQPIASNLTPEGRAQNRRVEIVILPR